jgi:hypothetical protein
LLVFELFVEELFVSEMMRNWGYWAIFEFFGLFSSPPRPSTTDPLINFAKYTLLYNESSTPYRYAYNISYATYLKIVPHMQFLHFRLVDDILQHFFADHLGLLDAHAPLGAGAGFEAAVGVVGLQFSLDVLLLF